MKLNNIYNINCLEGLKQIDDNCIDLIATDPPYGLKFMGKNWDKALPDPEVFRECLRVLKPGCFAFVMSAPRSDLQSRMSIMLEDVGFNIGFTPIYWTFASGFPKATNISKFIDKRLGKEKIIGKGKAGKTALGQSSEWNKTNNPHEFNITEPNSPEAKALNGCYAGFQPKPAIEVVIVAMKPLSEKNYISQALKSLDSPECGEGGTWLDDCRIPYEQDDTIIAKNPHTRTKGSEAYNTNCYGKYKPKEDFIDYTKQKGRFPANLLVSDDVLNDGKVTKSRGGNSTPIDVGSKVYNWNKKGKRNKPDGINPGYGDVGSFSRYFSLDAWADKLPEEAQKTFPFLIVPKASKSEKNKGLDLPKYKSKRPSGVLYNKEEPDGFRNSIKRGNNHPTVKPLKLMSYLITLGSREGQTVLDPYSGSGTTCISAKILNRNYIGFELEEEYKTIADARLKSHETEPQKPLTAF